MVNRVPIVGSWNRDDPKRQYGAFITAVGYERRARHIAETIHPRATKRLACAFPDRKLHHYDDNLKWFKNAGYKVEEIQDKAFREWCESILSQIRNSKLAHQSICIDISSLNRFRIAVIIDTIRRIDWVEDIRVDFLYSVAEFSPPPEETVPNTHVGPVLPSFAGWTSEPDLPPSAIVGLGYEENKALGAVEHIQAAEAWVFVPESPIPNYAHALEEANQILLDSIPTKRQLKYSVNQPLDCFITLESLSSRILRTNSLVLFPFGPKIFTLCALLIACLYPSVAVWRVSTGPEGEANDRTPSGHIYGLSVNFIFTDYKHEQKLLEQAIFAI